MANLKKIFDEEANNINEGLLGLAQSATSFVLLATMSTLAIAGAGKLLERWGYTKTIQGSISRFISAIKNKIAGIVKRQENTIRKKNPALDSFVKKIQSLSTDQIETRTSELAKEYRKLSLSDEEKMVIVKIISEKFGEPPVSVTKNGKPTNSRSYNVIKKIMGSSEAKKIQKRIIKSIDKI